MKSFQSLVIIASLIISGSVVAEINNYGIPFAENTAGSQHSNSAKNTLSVDKGIVLGNQTNPAVKQPVTESVSNKKNTSSETPHSVSSKEKNTSDGTNIQPVPSHIVQPTRRSDDPQSRQEIIVEPGVNTLIPISLGQINRIVTPFERPTIQRLQLDNVKVTVEGNVVYVYTSNTGPVAIYISEKGDESVSISLSLVPQGIPPVQVTLMLARKLNNIGSSPMMYAGSETKAKKWEQKDSYVETIRNILRTVALGDIPPGYALGNLAAGVSIPNCHFSTGTVQDYIQYNFDGGQFINGSQFSVIVGVAQNTGPTTVTVDESLCTHPRMAARALWSRNTIEPGQKTEAYFVIRNDQRQVRVDDGVRPKLAE